LSLKFTLFPNPSNKEQILCKHSREPEITFFTLFLHNGYNLPDREILATKTGEKQMSSTETDEQIKLRTVLGLLSELQSKGKITGKQFREYRELWINQQPNDRDVTVWNLKQLLNHETKPALPKYQSNGTQKKPTRQKL
jgi:hypothetical protein